MICTQCGCENPDTAKFCNGCGERFYAPGLKPADCADGSVPTPSKICPACGLLNAASASTCDCGNSFEKGATQASNHLNVDRQGSSKQLSGVGGWLLLLCLILCVFSPAGWLILLLARPQLRLLPVGAVIAYGIVAGYKLWKIRPRAVRFARTFLIVNISVNACIALVMAIFVSPVAASRDMGTIVWSTIWLLYLRRSARVANTFREKPQDEGGRASTLATSVSTEQLQPKNAKRGLGFESDEKAHRNINEGGAVLGLSTKSTAPPSSIMSLPQTERISPTETTSATPSEATEGEPGVSYPLKIAPVAHPIANRRTEDSSLPPGPAGTYNGLKLLIVLAVVFMTAIGGIFLLSPLFQYKYLNRESIPYRYDRFSGRTDVFTVEGWAPVSFDRPLIKIPSDLVSDRVSLPPGMIGSPNAYTIDTSKLLGMKPIPSEEILVGDQADMIFDESEECLGVDNNSNYMVKSISVHLVPESEAKGDYYTAQALLTDGGKLLVPGGHASMCGTIVDKEDYTPLSSNFLRAMGKWEFNVEEVEGWKP